jgi:hypothetical protein
MAYVPGHISGFSPGGAGDARGWLRAQSVTAVRDSLATFPPRGRHKSLTLSSHVRSQLPARWPR